MKINFKKYIMLIFFICSLMPEMTATAVELEGGDDSWQQLIQSIYTAMDKSGTPGASIVVVDRTGVQVLNYGYANQEEEKPVSEETLFELGSMSKAFTALGILYLEQEGKINLEEDIRDYFPWLTLYYHGWYKGERVNGEVSVTIGDFLYHTTGIPFETIGNIPEGDEDDMLVKTVRGLIGTELDFYPGTEYSYATINYDVLGLLIQEVTGKTYEDFITEMILKPLGLNQTYLYKQEAAATGQYAVGYKAEFFRAVPYEAPEYRGNTPAGYIISNTEDMAKWIQIQMGFVEVPETFRQLIEKSHKINSRVRTQNDYAYAAGWNVHIRGEGISHGGSNPNFSSMIFMDQEKEIGICILTNLNSNAPGYIVENFWNVLYHSQGGKYHYDIYKSLDTIFTLLLGITTTAILLFLLLLSYTALEIMRGKRIREKLQKGKVAGILIAVPIMIFWIYCIYFLPNILMGRLPWKAVSVWGAKSIIFGSIGAGLAGILFFLYVLLTFNFPRPGEKNYVTLTLLSIGNGLSSALIIFTINESFNRNLEYSRELFVYFLFALTFFVYTIKLVQGRLIIVTNEIAYEKRVAIIDGVMHSEYSKIEEIGSSRINSGLNNDANAIADLPGLLISIASNALTLIFCLAYLLTKSPPAFWASSGVILTSCLVSLLTGKAATKYWEKNRDIQNTYYGQISDLVCGFKELILGRRKKNAFWEDIRENTKSQAELSKAASIKFLNFGIYNTLMYNLIFGIVVFVFPLLIMGISVNELRENLFLVFYLIGPFGQLMSSIPNLMKIKVNRNRIDELIRELEEQLDIGKGANENDIQLSGTICLKLQDITFQYGNEDTFLLGPVNAEIKTGEIVYVIGGNGSGKSTLGKLVTGLYRPQRGRILLNDEESSIQGLNECFSAVFSDFYLFPKLYGVNMKEERDELKDLLKRMKLEDKIEIDGNGNLSSLELSTGQKKRLAFIISCLDDKPFLLFDEWAAEQDPDFRQYFYHQLLPQLKQKGKGIIVITHDDRFFHLADRIIKLERGKML